MMLYVFRYRIPCGKNELYSAGKGCVPFKDVPQCRSDPVPPIVCTKPGFFSMVSLFFQNVLHIKFMGQFYKRGTLSIVYLGF